MLFTGLCHAFFFVTNLLVSAFPSAGTLTWLSSASAGVANVMGLMHKLDTYVPIGTFVTVIGIYLAIWLIITGVVAIRKLWSLFTGGGGV